MSAFGKLPFQFQQRGESVAAAVAQAVSDPRLLAQHLTKRDQDLEDYLATIKGGGRENVAVFTVATAPQVIAAGAPQADLALTFAGGVGGLEHADTAGYVPSSSSSPGAFTIVTVQTQWSSTALTTKGMAEFLSAFFPAQAVGQHIPAAAGPTLSVFQQSAQVSQLPPNVPLNTLTLSVKLTDVLPDITTSGGPMAGITEMSLDFAVAYIYLVD